MWPSILQGQHLSTSVNYTQHIPHTEVSFEMMLIPGGTFTMGSPEDELGRKADEGPLHRIKIDSLYVGKYEVTWEVFELFFNENKHLFESLPKNINQDIDAIVRPSPPFEDPSLGMGKSGFPVVNVSPYAALTFCKWLSVLTGKFYRLPTEAEWEYACRAGSNSPYGFGNDLTKLPQYAVYLNNSQGQYTGVGTKKPNAWGIFDMHGNVSEWTLDQYQAEYYLQFEDSLGDNPWKIPNSLHPRVFRGGSWDDYPEDLRSAARGKSGVYLQRNDPQIPKSFWWYTDAAFIGFRLVSPVNQPSVTKLEEFWSVVLDE